MKNIFKSIMAFVAGAFVFTSCVDFSNDLLSDNVVNLSQSTMSFAAQPADCKTVTVNLEGDWIAVLPSDCDWLTVKPSFGRGKQEVKVYAKDNLDGTGALAGPRKSQVNFSTTGGTSVLAVSQMGDITKNSSKTYAKATEVTPGGSYLLVVKNGADYYIGTPVATTSTYAYLLKYDVTDKVDADGNIVMPNGSYAFTFEPSATAGAYILRQADGEALWQNASYNNFYTDVTPTEGFNWTPAVQDDGTFIITNELGKWLQYSLTYSSFGGYSASQDNALLPYLYGNADKALEVSPKAVELTDGDLEETFTIVVPSDLADAVPADEWITLVGSETDGTNTTLTFKVQKNPDLAVRTGSILVGTVDAVATVNVTQPARAVTPEDITDKTVAEFNACEKGDFLYRVTGVISEIANAEKGRFYIKDYSGETYVYNMSGFAESGAKVNDIVTVIGKRDQYNTTIEMTSAYFDKNESGAAKITPVTTITPTEFLTKEDSKTVWYCTTGTITTIDNATYGNIHITDGTSEIYVYGLYPGYGATGDARKNFIATAGIQVGDEVTVIGYKDTYKGTVEYCGGVYVSHSTPTPPSSKGTAENPYTIAEVVEYCSTLTGNSPEDVYVAGTVCELTKYNYGEKYNTASFWLSDDGTTNGAKFEAYSIYYMNNAAHSTSVAWPVETGVTITVGQKIVLCGKVTTYNGVAETASKKAHIVSIDGKTE